MCEFCTKHGEGRKWYENIANYTEEVFYQVNSDNNLKEYLADFYRSLKEDIANAYTWKKRFPRIYNFLVYPLFTKRLKKTHFGQIVPIEDIEHVLDQVSTIMRLPCICRKVTTGENKRYCFGVGMDLTPYSKISPISEISTGYQRKRQRNIYDVSIVKAMHTVSGHFRHPLLVQYVTATGIAWPTDSS